MSKIHFSGFGKGIAAGIWRDACEEPVQLMNQVHGTTIVEVFELGTEPEADALVTRVPGLRIAVKTADCIPLVMADEGAGVAAAVHAGWRGLTADIIPKVLDRLASIGADMARLKVLVGPSLGVECAEFSDPEHEIPAKFHWAIEGRRVNLNAIARRQLEEAGVQHIEWMEICTRCNTEWPSWRRTHADGRFFTWIELSSLAPSHL